MGSYVRWRVKVMLIVAAVLLVASVCAGDDIAQIERMAKSAGRYGN